MFRTRFITLIALLLCLTTNSLYAISFDSLLIKATVENDYEKTKQLLESGSDANTIDSEGASALMLAAKSGNPETVELLLTYKANVDYRNEKPDYYSVLDCAAISGNINIINILLNVGANIDLEDSLGNNALSTALLREDPKMSNHLISKGAKLNEARVQSIFSASADTESLLYSQRAFKILSENSIVRLLLENGYVIQEDELPNDRSVQYVRAMQDDINTDIAEHKRKDFRLNGKLQNMSLALLLTILCALSSAIILYCRYKFSIRDISKAFIPFYPWLSLVFFIFLSIIFNINELNTRHNGTQLTAEVYYSSMNKERNFRSPPPSVKHQFVHIENDSIRYIISVDKTSYDRTSEPEIVTMCWDKKTNKVAVLNPDHEQSNIMWIIIWSIFLLIAYCGVLKYCISNIKFVKELKKK